MVGAFLCKELLLSVSSDLFLVISEGVMALCLSQTWGACFNGRTHKALVVFPTVGGHQGARHTITSEKLKQPERVDYNAWQVTREEEVQGYISWTRW